MVGVCAPRAYFAQKPARQPRTDAHKEVGSKWGDGNLVMWWKRAWESTRSKTVPSCDITMRIAINLGGPHDRGQAADADGDLLGGRAPDARPASKEEEGASSTMSRSR